MEGSSANMIKTIQWLKSKLSRPKIWSLAILGGMIVPFSMVGAQIMFVPRTEPDNLFVLMFLIFTIPGRIFGYALDPILGSWHRQSITFFGLFIAVSMLVNAFVFGAVGVWWDSRGKRLQNKKDVSNPAPPDR